MKKLFIAMLALCAVVLTIPQISFAQNEADLLKLLGGGGAPAATPVHHGGGGPATPKVDPAELKKLQDEMAKQKADSDKAVADMKASLDKLMGVEEKRVEEEKRNNIPLILSIISLCISVLATVLGGMGLAARFRANAAIEDVHFLGGEVQEQAEQIEELTRRLDELAPPAGTGTTGP
jgi:hypothetical protein